MLPAGLDDVTVDECQAAVILLVSGNGGRRYITVVTALSTVSLHALN